jgi:hypothetical protein
VKLQSAIALRDIVGGPSHNPLRGAPEAARKVKPHGIGWVPDSWNHSSREKKAAIYKHKREIGRLSDSAWAAICNNYPELKGTK